MAEEAKREEMLFENEEAREAALAALPDEPPTDVRDVDAWTREQEEQEQKILNAQVKVLDSEEAVSEEQPPVSTEKPPEPEKKVETADDFVDFTSLGKLKREELDEDLRNYKSPQEMLKQAAHARRYANKAQTQLEEAQARVAELEQTAASVPELQKKITELQATTQAAAKSIETKPSLSSSEKVQFQSKLKGITAQLESMKEFDSEDMDKFRGAFGETVSTLGETLNELNGVKSEFATYRQQTEQKFQALDGKVGEYATKTDRSIADQKRRKEEEDAVNSLLVLQGKRKELATTKPLYSDDRNDVETAIARMASRFYGRPLRGTVEDWSDINRMVSAFNVQDKQVERIMQEEGINVADFGISEKDLLNYAILMNVDAYQRGERIDSQTGKRTPYKDFRGKQVRFPDAEAAYKHMLDKEGIPQLEQEQAVIEAEKRGQTKLEASLSKRDTDPAVLGNEGGGSPDIGEELSEAQAREIIGEEEGRMTIDEEKMEKHLRNGHENGWKMFSMWKLAHKRLGLEEPAIEPQWITVETAQRRRERRLKTA